MIHRAGSDRPSLHFHALFRDGAYAENGSFFTAPAPRPSEVEGILARIVRRAAKLFEDEQPEPDDLTLALFQAHAAGSPAERHRPEDERPHDFGLLLPTRRKARIETWDLDAEVAVHSHDRDRLEQLCRYLLRPPLALDRLKLLGEGCVCLELKRPWQDGTTHLTMTPAAFLSRLATLVPRPRANTVLYFGVLAAHAARRDAIVPRGEDRRRPDSSFAALMRHSFGIHVLACPRCGKWLQFRAVILDRKDRKEVRRLLQELRSSCEPLPVHPARGPPEAAESLCFP